MHLSTVLVAAGLAVSMARGDAVFPPIPEDKTTPYGQHLTMFAPHTIVVAWSTYEPLDKVCVAYGTEENSLNSTVCGGESHTIPDTRQYQHSVHLKGLESQQKYFYKIQSTNSSTWSFKTAIAPGSSGEFTFGLVTDMGLYGENGFVIGQGFNTASGGLTKRDIPWIEPNLTHTTIEALAHAIGGANPHLPHGLDFVAHAGDLAYSDDWYWNIEDAREGVSSYEAVEERFYEQLAPISGRIPYMVGPGNHEADCTESGYWIGLCPQGYSNFTEFRGRFALTHPKAYASTSSNKTAVELREKAASLANPPMWYSFDYGLAHIVMINTETDFEDSPDGIEAANLFSGPFGYKGQQLDWLKADLASVDRDVTPWVFVGGHRPWYTTNSPDEACEPCGAAFDDILYRHGVDLAWFGHEHNSQRFLPMHGNQTDKAGYNNPKAPVYLVAGAAGNIEGLTFHKTFPDGFAWGNDHDYAFATLTVHNRTHVTSRFFRSSDGAKIDDQTLYKEHKESSVYQV